VTDRHGVPVTAWLVVSNVVAAVWVSMVPLDTVLGVVAARVAAIVGSDIVFARCSSRCEMGA
jgi:hypothetical protein